MLSSLLPADLDLLTALALIGLSLVTSLVTATFSLGGGTLMIAALALVFPPAVVVPLHGAVQLGSNGGRALIQFRHIRWDLVVWIATGAIVGIVVGAQFASALPEQLLTALIGIFVLVTTWLPFPSFVGTNRVLQVIGGAVISALSMVVGATGALIATFIRGLGDRRELVSTHAMLMTIQNTAKVAAFVFLGFAFASYLPLILAMVAAGFVGTAIGSRLLVRVPEHVFRIGFKIVLTIVALALLRDAFLTAA